MLQILENTPCIYRIIMEDDSKQKYWVCTYDKYFIINEDKICIECPNRKTKDE